MADNQCDACGRDLANNRVGVFLLCSRCASMECMETALKLAKQKHKEMLEGLLRKEG